MEIDGDTISRNFSPFCCFSVKNKDISQKEELITCALISPIMAIAPSRFLCDKEGFIFYDNIVIEGMIKNKKVERKVAKSVLFKDRTLILFMLEEPVWQLGWCGITFLQQK